MSMILQLCTLSDANVRKVLADPPLILKVVARDDPDACENYRRKQSGGLLSKLFGRGQQHSSPLELADDEVVETDLDKAWHGIHYLLTQTAWEGSKPLNFLICGGSEIGSVEVGYGTVRAFSADEVKAVRAALLPLDREFLRARFKPTEMKRLDIYPSIWDVDPDEDDNFGYCADYFESLKAFIEQAASRNMGLVVYLT